MMYSEMYNNILFEQEAPNEEEEQVQEEPQEPIGFTPLKKYMLMQSLTDLRNKLDQVNMSNTDLDTIIMFSSELPYETLIILVDKITDVIIRQIKGATKK